MKYLLVYLGAVMAVWAQAVPVPGTDAIKTDTTTIKFNYPAEPHEYLWKMIACDEADEGDIGSLYNAYLNLLQNHAIGTQIGGAPDSEVSFPVSRAAVANKDYVIASLAYYVAPNELRGFEISFPRQALELKGRRYVLKERLVLAGEDFKQAIHLLTLKRMK
ncbi:MAG: hypothetical protein JSS11_06100 [Verrucomicrobia bacterium]|nr:hypothetical protein [Verrucomicrobiota bacterium]